MPVRRRGVIGPRSWLPSGVIRFERLGSFESLVNSSHPSASTPLAFDLQPFALGIRPKKP